MARARNIKPGTFKNELLGSMEPLAVLLFISLWTLADREGRVEDRPLRIKAETFPYRENIDVNGYLTLLERYGFISRYEVAGIRVIQITKFAEHQNPHGTEKDSTLPDRDGYLTIHERNRNCVTGKFGLVHFENQSVNDFNVNVTLSNVNSRNDNALIPSSLNPDSLLLNPSTLNPEKKNSRFAPPSLSDVTAYIHARGSPVSPESFVDFYSSNGWKVGKNMMKDWQACIRTWEKRDETNKRSGKISNAEHRRDIGDFIEKEARSAAMRLSQGAYPENEGDIPPEVGRAVSK